jgi:hypothetical protein
MCAPRIGFLYEFQNDPITMPKNMVNMTTPMIGFVIINTICDYMTM